MATSENQVVRPLAFHRLTVKRSCSRDVALLPRYQVLTSRRSRGNASCAASHRNPGVGLFPFPLEHPLLTLLVSFIFQASPTLSGKPDGWADTLVKASCRRKAVVRWVPCAMMVRPMRLRQYISEEGRLLLAVALACLLIGVLLDRLDRNRIEAAAREQASQVAADILQNLNTRINRKAILLGRLVAVAESTPVMTDEAFRRDGERIFQDINASTYGREDDSSAIMSIAMAPDLVIRHVYPLDTNNGLLGFDYREHPNQLPDVQAALFVPTPVVSRPFMSVQGFRALAVRQRYQGADGTIEGVVSIAINLDSLFSQLARNAKADWGHSVAFNIDRFSGFGDRTALGLEPLVVDLKTYDLDWSIAVAPIGGWPKPPMITQSRVLVASIAAFLMILVHLRTRRAMRQRRRESRMEKAIDALSAGFVIFNKDGRLVHWNDTFQEMFNYGTLLRKGMSYEELLRGGLQRGTFKVEHGTEEQWVQRNLKFYREADSATELQLASGRWIKSLSRRTDHGDVVGVRFDVTDVKNAQLAAERASNAKSEMVSVISHELRTPLTTIIGFGKLLQNAPPTTGDQEKDQFVADALNRMLSAGHHLFQLIEEMLDYVQLGSQAAPLKIEKCDLSRLIDRKVEAISPVANDKRVSLRVESGEVMVYADPDRVAQILNNLLSNALKFTAPGGTVQVNASKHGQFAHVSVSDTGKGIPREKLNGIFEEFFQVSPSGQRREGGLGMGLAITKRLVELQGGRIEVESTEGKGSTFSLRLPLAPVSA